MCLIYDLLFRVHYSMQLWFSINRGFPIVWSVMFFIYLEILASGPLIVSLESGKGEVLQSRRSLLLWSGLDVLFSCPTSSPLTAYPSFNQSTPNAFWEPLVPFTLEDGGMLQCHPESGYCCFLPPVIYSQGSKGRRKWGCSIPVFPLYAYPLTLGLLSAVHTGTQTLLSLKGFQSGRSRVSRSITSVSFCRSPYQFGREKELAEVHSLIRLCVV